MRRVPIAALLVSLLIATPASAMEVSEFRFFGPGGPTDEYVELFNETDAPVVVGAADGSSGWALAASDGTARFVVPNGTTIPAHGHFLGVGAGYGLGSYPAGSGTTASGDATFATDIPNNGGIALFDTSNPANFTLAHRLDAAGAINAPSPYREGTGVPEVTPFASIKDEAFFRDQNTATGIPRDTGNNAADFRYVDPNGVGAGAGQRLGAAGPENLSSPVATGGLSIDLIDPTMAATAPPNAVRDFFSDPGNNSTYGTIDIRRKVTNTTNAPITRLRFRITDLTTFPDPQGTSDLRARSSTAAVVTIPSGNVTVQGTELEAPPAQANGGGVNSSLSVPAVTTAAPLAPGASIYVRFLLGNQATGGYRFCANAEAADAGGAVAQTGFTGSGDTPAECARAPTFRPRFTSDPTIEGTPRQASALTAGYEITASPDPSVTFTWQRCNASGAGCTNIAGAHDRTYVPGTDDVGHPLRVQVGASNGLGGMRATSEATAAIEAIFAPVSTAAPAISGTAAIGSTLTATDGDWTGTTPISFTHAWQRCDSSGANCEDIGGASGPAYTVTSTDAGSTVRAVVTASNVAGATTARSTAVGPVAHPAVQHCVVPNLKGRKLAAAKRALKAARCKVGKVKRKRSRKVKPGRVIALKPKAGRVLPAGSKVALVVAKRPRR